MAIGVGIVVAQSYSASKFADYQDKGTASNPLYVLAGDEAEHAQRWPLVSKQLREPIRRDTQLLGIRYTWRGAFGIPVGETSFGINGDVILVSHSTNGLLVIAPWALVFLASSGFLLASYWIRIKP